MTTPRGRGRPPVSSPEAIEAKAFELLLRDGFEATTVEAITTAAGVGRTTFFRYFGTKGGVVWGEFDRAIERLRAAVWAEEPGEPMQVVRAAVVESTRQSRMASPASWLDRFRVLDRDPALTGETAAHWRAWATVVSEYVQHRVGPAVESSLTAAIGGAVQAAYVSVLRDWSAAGDDDVDLQDLERALDPLVAAFGPLLAP